MDRSAYYVIGHAAILKADLYEIELNAIYMDMCGSERENEFSFNKAN